MNVTQSRRSDSINGEDEHIYFTISELNASRNDKHQQQFDADKAEQSVCDWPKQSTRSCWQEYWRWCDLYFLLHNLRIFTLKFFRSGKTARKYLKTHILSNFHPNDFMRCNWKHKYNILFSPNYCYSEQSIIGARASVMVYDDGQKKWVPSGSSSGLSKVHIYHHQQNNTFRVVGRKLQDHEVVINCSILKGLKYNQATATFHQWRDSKFVYGLNFSSQQDAEAFARAMMHALEVRIEYLLHNVISIFKAFGC